MSTDRIPAKIQGGLFIDGRFVPAADGTEVAVINPADESIVAYAALAGREDAERAVQGAARSFEKGIWSRMPIRSRAKILHQIADGMEQQFQAFVLLLQLETGSTAAKAKVEVSSCIDGFRTFAEIGTSGYQHDAIPPSAVNGMASLNLVQRVPIGTAAGIIPWNWPLYLAMWKSAPALITGNSLILKTSNEACLTVLKLAEICAEAGLPDGVLQVINGAGPIIGEYLVLHKDIAKISFTGSTVTGKRIMGLAAASIKRISLELGGRSAQIVMEDADLKQATDGILFAGYNHAGQTCHNGTRILVPRCLHDELVSRLILRSKDIMIGNPLLHPSAGMGPIISLKQLERVESYVSMGVEEGAEIVAGGKRPTGVEFEKGFWYEPTILIHATNNMNAVREEIFGPVLAIIPYDDLAEAIHIANDSAYGLAGNIWSGCLETAMETAMKMRTGTVWINDASLVNIYAPFGGFKESGLGRESGLHGLLAYTELQHIHVGISAKKPYLESLFAEGSNDL